MHERNEPALQLDAALYDQLMLGAGAIYAALAAAGQREPGAAPPPILQLRSGLAESPGWFLLQAAEFDPEPLTVTGLRVRDTYASERIVGALLELLASEGWLGRGPADEYALTDAGRGVLAALLERRRRLLGGITLLPAASVERLNEMLGRVVVASQAAPEPPGTWCLAHSRRRAPPPEAPPLAHLLQLFEDLNAFRDDAHMAGWGALGVAGHVWEAFALVWAGEARTPGDLFRTLAHRGYSQAEYAAALDLLAARGWLARGQQGSYTVTPAGQAARAGVEQQTDAGFYAPWSVLQPAELVELRQLLADLAASV
jgi:hypothetical protein